MERPEPQHARDVFEQLRYRVEAEPDPAIWVLGVHAARAWSVMVIPRTRALTMIGRVFTPLLAEGATACVLCHHHPGGDPQPSAADLRLTLYLKEVGDLLKIPVLDHVVIAGNQYISMAEVLAP